MFIDDFDRTEFCRRLGYAIGDFAWTCHTFCLMTTHYHLLVDADLNRLQPGMHRLNGPYAQAFNKRHGRWGHLRGARYSAEPVLSEGHFLRAYRYIIRNPVKAGLCEETQDWRWSSYRGTMGLDKPFWFVTHRRVLSCFGPLEDKAIPKLRDFAEDQ